MRGFLPGLLGALALSAPAVAQVEILTPSSSVARVLATASTNAHLVKGSPGTLNAYQLCNSFSQTRYVRLFDSAGSPNVGADTPAFDVVLQGGACIALAPSAGINFSRGIAYDITAGPGDADTSVTGSGDVTGAFYFN